MFVAGLPSCFPPTISPIVQLAPVLPYFPFYLLPYPGLAPLPLSTPWPHSYWDSAFDDDVMENRVGLNLLYAQVSLELPQNPSPENDSGVPLFQENSFYVFSPSSWGNLLEN